jgi:hypothetical protein
MDCICIAPPLVTTMRKSIGWWILSAMQSPRSGRRADASCRSAFSQRPKKALQTKRLQTIAVWSLLLFQTLTTDNGTRRTG